MTPPEVLPVHPSAAGQLCLACEVRSSLRPCSCLLEEPWGGSCLVLLPHRRRTEPALPGAGSGATAWWQQRSGEGRTLSGLVAGLCTSEGTPESGSRERERGGREREREIKINDNKGFLKHFPTNCKLTGKFHNSKAQVDTHQNLFLPLKNLFSHKHFPSIVNIWPQLVVLTGGIPVRAIRWRRRLARWACLSSFL